MLLNIRRGGEIHIDRDLANYLDVLAITRGISLSGGNIVEANKALRHCCGVLEIGVKKQDLIAFIIGSIIVDGTFAETYLIDIMCSYRSRVEDKDRNTFNRLNRRFIQDMVLELDKSRMCDRVPIIRKYSSEIKQLIEG